MNDWNKISKRKTLGEFPQEASENLQAPESAPVDFQVAAKITKLEESYALIQKQLKEKKIIMNEDQRITGRIKKISFTCHPDFHRELKDWAYKENCYQIEVLERAFEEYKKKRGGKDE